LRVPNPIFLFPSRPELGVASGRFRRALLIDLRAPLRGSSPGGSNDARGAAVAALGRAGWPARVPTLGRLPRAPLSFAKKRMCRQKPGIGPGLQIAQRTHLKWSNPRSDTAVGKRGPGGSGRGVGALFPARRRLGRPDFLAPRTQAAPGLLPIRRPAGRGRLLIARSGRPPLDPPPTKKKHEIPKITIFGFSNVLIPSQGKILFHFIFC